MERSERYVVKTRWGVFSLDEGSYQDYLAGKLWISTGTNAAQMTKHNAKICDRFYSEEARKLWEQAAKNGILETLQSLGVERAIVPYHKRVSEISIEEMNLSVRSNNGLKRVGIETFGQLQAWLVAGNTIRSIRNLGEKSVKEIKKNFFELCYAQLSGNEQMRYWQKVMDSLESQGGCV